MKLTPAALLAIAIVTPLAVACHYHPEDESNNPHANHPHAATSAQAPVESTDWRAAESAALQNHVQLTHADTFYKAGEGYFSPDNRHFVFQAIPAPTGDEAPADFYGMYLTDVVFDTAGHITGLENIRLISPPDSANTCGWFHPTDPNLVFFGSTITPPVATPPPGYQRGGNRYNWAFPPEMRIVSYDMRKTPGSEGSVTTIIGDADAYQAEDALSSDGRYMVYCSLETGDGDLYIHDFKTGRDTLVVAAPGYDGGPFFSPDGKRLCYRSDRLGNNLLQLFIAELKFDADGSVIGIDREFQLTDNTAVNWAPFWHPDARHLIYTSSEISHSNYELFLVDADPGFLKNHRGPVKYGTHKRRISFAPGADVLPTFSPDGKYLAWTSKRSGDPGAQLWAADFVLDLDAPPASAASPHGH